MLYGVNLTGAQAWKLSKLRGVIQMPWAHDLCLPPKSWVGHHQFIQYRRSVHVQYSTAKWEKYCLWDSSWLMPPLCFYTIHQFIIRLLNIMGPILFLPIPACCFNIISYFFPFSLNQLTPKKSKCFLNLENQKLLFLEGLVQLQEKGLDALPLSSRSLVA